MTPTVDEHWRAVDFFVEAMAGLGDDVQGVILTVLTSQEAAWRDFIAPPGNP